MWLVTKRCTINMDRVAFIAPVDNETEFALDMGGVITIEKPFQEILAELIDGGQEIHIPMEEKQRMKEAVNVSASV